MNEMLLRHTFFLALTGNDRLAELLARDTPTNGVYTNAYWLVCALTVLTSPFDYLS
jgi:hypothetical protein